MKLPTLLLKESGAALNTDVESSPKFITMFKKSKVQNSVCNIFVYKNVYALQMHNFSWKDRKW